MRPGFVAPTVAAKMSNTFDQLTHGRVLINVVTGGFPHELAADGDFTEHDERYARTQEFMQVVRKAWIEPKSWSHEGKYYKVEKGNVFPKPYQKPRPPFYFGGASDAAKHVGAEEADVYLLWGETIPMVRERIADMRERAAKLGRTLRFGMRLLVVARETDDEARAAAEALVADVPENFEGMMQKHMSRRRHRGREAPARAARAGRRGGDWVAPEPLDRHRPRAARRRAGARRLRRERRGAHPRVRRRGHRHLHLLRLPAPRGGAALRQVRDAALRRRSSGARRPRRSASLSPPDMPDAAHGMKAVAISGSPRAPSKSKTLAELMLNALERDGCEISMIDVADLPAEALLARASSSEIDAAIAAVGEAQIVVAATPTYRALYTGALKCLFDLMPPAHLRARSACRCRRRRRRSTSSRSSTASARCSPASTASPIAASTPPTTSSSTGSRRRSCSQRINDVALAAIALGMVTGG